MDCQAIVDRCNALYAKADNLSKCEEVKDAKTKDEESPFVTVARIENHFSSVYHPNANFLLTLCDRSCDHMGQDCDCVQDECWPVTKYNAQVVSTDSSVVFRFESTLPRVICKKYLKSMSDVYCWRVAEVSPRSNIDSKEEEDKDKEMPLIDIHLDATDTAIGRIDTFGALLNPKITQQVASYDLTDFTLSETELVFRARCI